MQIRNYIFVAAILFFSGSTTVLAESISHFESTYTVKESGVVEVVETITYDFESEERHGIFRVLEKSHPQGPSTWYKTRAVGIDVLSVKRNGVDEPYDTSYGLGDIEIKIGDEDETVTGSHVYEIAYTLTGALSYGTDGAELYWNVTGNTWDVEMANVVATVESDALTGTNACYQGTSGEVTACTAIEPSDTSVVYRAESLAVGEELSIAAELDQSKVAVLTTEEINYLPFGFALISVLFLVLMVAVYRWRVAGKKDLPIIAQYEPYAEYLPMYTGVLFDLRLDTHDITAGIMYLAEQGFIKITKTSRKVLLLIEVDDYDLTLKRPLAEIPTLFLKKLSTLLFDENAGVGDTVAISKLAKKQTENWKIIQDLQTSITEDLKATGITTSTTPRMQSWMWFGLVVLMVGVVALFFITNGFALVMYVFFLTIILVIMIFTPRRTAIGYEALNHIQGFKLFLSVTDKERFDFHNAPEKSPELFMEYLPYAVALGVEKKWAKVFEGITIPQPDWYDGGHFGAFSAVALTNDLGAFSSSFSASSGTSGSGGAGSAGGGGGGGGGGSW